MTTTRWGRHSCSTSFEISTNIHPTRYFEILVCSRQRINRYCTRWHASFFIRLILLKGHNALVWTCFVNHNEGLTGCFFGTSFSSSSSLSSSESVPLSFSESSPTTLAVVSDQLRDDPPKTVFKRPLKNAEHRVISIYERKARIRTSNLTHTQATLLLILIFRLI